MLTARNTTVPTGQVESYVTTLQEIENYTRSVGTPAVLILGLVCNSLAIATLVRMRHERSVSFLIALSVSDTGVLFVGTMFWLSRKNIMTNLNSDDMACKLIMFLFFCFTHYSVLILVAMTTERFIAVWFPFKAKRICKAKHCIMLILAIALLVLLINAHNLFTRELVDVGNGTLQCLTTDIATSTMPYGDFHVNIWPWIDATVYSFIPCISLFVLNILIVVKLRSTRKLKVRTSGGTKPQRDQITKTLLIVTFAFLILSLPIAIIVVVEKFWEFESDLYQQAVWSLCRTIAGFLECINHSINIFLYCLGGERFRETVMKILCYDCVRRL